MEPDDLKAAATKSMEGDGDIRERVRELTLGALRERKFDFAAMRDVMSDVVEGVSIGAERRGCDARQALESAVKGMDDAFSKTAQATQLAWSEMVSKGREFSDTDLKATLETLRRMEGDFVSTLSTAAERAGAQMKTHLQDIATHASRTGVDAGTALGRTVAEFSKSMAGTATEMTQSSMEAARLLSERLAEATSGFLAGLSDALSRRDGADRK